MRPKIPFGMARLREATGVGRISGNLDGFVVAQYPGGAVLRLPPKGRGAQTPARSAVELRMRQANVLWSRLDDDAQMAWVRYGQGRATRSPETGRPVTPSGYSLFVALATKFLQVHGGHEAPTLPPEGPFFGDALAVSFAPAPQALLASAPGANRPGMLTEVLGQPLRRLSHAPKSRGYKSLGFFAFEAGTPVTIPLTKGGAWALQVRFVEASTGRMTEPVDVDWLTVPA